MRRNPLSWELLLNVLLSASGLALAIGGVAFLSKSSPASMDSRFIAGMVLSIGAIALLSSIIFSLNYRINTFFTFLTIMFSLFALECFIPMVDAIKANKAQQARRQQATSQSLLTASNYDRRTKHAVVSDMRAEGKEVYPSAHPGGLLTLPIRSANGSPLLPLGGVANMTSVFCNEGGQYTIYESDEHGFHNPKGLYAKGELEIAALGDSIVHGSCVPSGKDILGQIRQEVPRSLNLGMYGSGPILELAAFREFIEPLEPKIVLWFILDSDISDITVEKNISFLQNYFNQAYSQNLINRQSEVDGLLKTYLNNEIFARRKKSRIADVNGQMTAEQPDNNPPKTVWPNPRDVLLFRNLRRKANLIFSEDLVVLQHTLKLAADRTKSWNGKFYLVYVPDQEQVAQPERNSIYKGSIKEISSALEIPFIDVDIAIKAHPDPLSLFPFRGRRHFNEDGYKLVAKTILQKLREHGQVK